MTPIPYGRQTITEADVAAVVEALSSDYLTQGPRVEAFERAFAAHVGAPYAVAVANGTAALHLCALALDVQPGQRVITSPITFVASANCVRYCGGTVEFADIDPDTFCLDIAQVRRRLEAAPRGTYAGLIPVDFAGYPVDLPAWRALADAFGLWIIEDACHAPGAARPSHRAGDGQFADLAIFSFHPVKHVATGEGGMITTARRDLYERLLLLRTHGITKDPALLSETPAAGGTKCKRWASTTACPTCCAPWACRSSPAPRADWPAAAPSPPATTPPLPGTLPFARRRWPTG